MLARIALDCSALTTPGSTSKAQLRSLHRELIEALLRHGIVINVSDAEFHTMVQNLPSDVQPYWKRAIRRLRHQVLATPSLCLCQITDEKTLEFWWKKKADIAVLEPDRAELLGVPVNAATLRNPSVEMELVRFGLLRDAEELAALKALSTKRIRRGDDRQQVWKERFEPLAKHADRIVICDRYAGGRLVAYGGNTGLSWLLERVYSQRKVRKGGKPYVRLIFGVDGDREGRVIEEANRNAIVDQVRKLRKVLAPSRADLTLELTLAPDFVFEKEAHDRHVRFDHQVFEIGIGVDIFRDRFVPSSSNCIYLGEESASEDADIEKIIESEAIRLRTWSTEEI